MKSICPESKVFDIPNETAKTINPTASSNATTGKRMSVTGPFALYCLTTMRVAAGAVAEAIAPSTTAASKGNLSGIAKCNTIKTASTSNVVTTACKIPTMVACLPIYIFAHFINLLLKRAVKLILKKSSANGKGPGRNGFKLR